MARRRHLRLPSKQPRRRPQRAESWRVRRWAPSRHSKRRRARRWRPLPVRRAARPRRRPWGRGRPLVLDALRENPAQGPRPSPRAQRSAGGSSARGCAAPSNHSRRGQCTRTTRPSSRWCRIGLARPPRASTRPARNSTASSPPTHQPDSSTPAGGSTNSKTARPPSLSKPPLPPPPRRARSLSRTGLPSVPLGAPCRVHPCRRGAHWSARAVSPQPPRRPPSDGGWFASSAVGAARRSSPRMATGTTLPRAPAPAV
mmetsp:Transcript_51249/g.116504  ORF Transcript_51249/g.116504 Transcript_51249/m.116504 type:complete len:257 (+) Transcript_51249:129-899(+)